MNSYHDGPARLMLNFNHAVDEAEVGDIINLKSPKYEARPGWHDLSATRRGFEVHNNVMESQFDPGSYDRLPLLLRQWRFQFAVLTRHKYVKRPGYYIYATVFTEAGLKQLGLPYAKTGESMSYPFEMWLGPRETQYTKTAEDDQHVR
jgi:hypothetical protein